MSANKQGGAKMLDSTRQLITDLETEWDEAIAGHYPGDLPGIWHDLKAAKRMAQAEELAGL